MLAAHDSEFAADRFWAWAHDHPAEYAVLARVEMLNSDVLAVFESIYSKGASDALLQMNRLSPQFAKFADFVDFVRRDERPVSAHNGER